MAKWKSGVWALLIGSIAAASVATDSAIPQLTKEDIATAKIFDSLPSVEMPKGTRVGSRLSNPTYQGKKSVVLFSKNECTACMPLVKSIRDLVRQYPKSQWRVGLKDGPTPTLMSYLQQGLNKKQLDVLSKNQIPKLQEEMGTPLVPSLMLVDEKQVVQGFWLGYDAADAAYLDTKITDFLRGKPLKPQDTTAHITVGKPAPLLTLSGWKAIKGRPTVVYVTSGTCPACQYVNTALVSLFEKLNSRGVEVRIVDTTIDAKTLKRRVGYINTHFPSLAQDYKLAAEQTIPQLTYGTVARVFKDSGNSIARRWGNIGTPRIYIFNSTGRFVREIPYRLASSDNPRPWFYQIERAVLP